MKLISMWYLGFDIEIKHCPRCKCYDLASILLREHQFKINYSSQGAILSQRVYMSSVALGTLVFARQLLSCIWEAVFFRA